MGTLEAVQALQVQNGHLQKSREGYHAKCIELERLRKEAAPQKELEKVRHSSLFNHVNPSLLVLGGGFKKLKKKNFFCLVFFFYTLLKIAGIRTTVVSIGKNKQETE